MGPGDNTEEHCISAAQVANVATRLQVALNDLDVPKYGLDHVLGAAPQRLGTFLAQVPDYNANVSLYGALCPVYTRLPGQHDIGGDSCAMCECTLNSQWPLQSMIS